MISFPNKKYELIYADPPWSYQDKSLHRGGAEKHYSCMSINDLCRLPVSNISSENSVLLLWTTFPQLKDSFRVVSSWGFKYVTVAFVWVKTNKSGGLFMGLGRYTRSNAEICLLAKRGKGLLRQSASIINVQLHNRMEHSRKPELFRRLVIDLFGDVSRIELFAREKCFGWDVWGNQTNKFTRG